jgi:hypothetical protein
MGRLSPDESALARHIEAASEGRYRDALAAFTTFSVSELLKVLTARGYDIVVEQWPTGTVGFYATLAKSIKDRIKHEGDETPLFLEWAHDLVQALTELLFLMTRKRADEALSPDEASQVILQAMVVGRMVERIGLTSDGHFDEFLRLKFGELEATEKRRAGAEKTNAKRRKVRERAVQAAVELCELNQMLSNEDLAVKVRDSLRLPTSIATMANWMRDGRRSGAIPPIKR